MQFEIYYKRKDGKLNKCGIEQHSNAKEAIQSIKDLFWKERFSLIDVLLEGTNTLIVSMPK